MKYPGLYGLLMNLDRVPVADRPGGITSADISQLIDQLTAAAAALPRDCYVIRSVRKDRAKAYDMVMRLRRQKS
jgi:hypothetical protein